MIDGIIQKNKNSAHAIYDSLCVSHEPILIDLMNAMIKMIRALSQTWQCAVKEHSDNFRIALLPGLQENGVVLAANDLRVFPHRVISLVDLALGHLRFDSLFLHVAEI